MSTRSSFGISDDDRQRAKRIVDQADRNLRAAFRRGDFEAVEEMTRPIEHDCWYVVEDDGTCFYCGKEVQCPSPRS